MNFPTEVTSYTIISKHSIYGFSSRKRGLLSGLYCFLFSLLSVIKGQIFIFIIALCVKLCSVILILCVANFYGEKKKTLINTTWGLLALHPLRVYKSILHSEKLNTAWHYRLCTVKCNWQRQEELYRICRCKRCLHCGGLIWPVQMEKLKVRVRLMINFLL